MKNPNLKPSLKPKPAGAYRTGVTLVELLVVISIMAILTAVMIPRLRVINQDRNIREAARVAASVFANASLRAINDGTAGVIVERNPNFIDSDGVYYGATTLYTMRAVPPYIGDEPFGSSGGGGAATRDANLVLKIPTPVQMTSQAIVTTNDFISVNYSSVRYQIFKVITVGAVTTLDLRNPAATSPEIRPSLPGVNGDSYPFVVHRQPRKLASSKVELPDGYIIDTRYSGPINLTPSPTLTTVPAGSRSYFHELINPGFGQQDLARTIQIIFNSSGAIDRYYFYDPDAGTTGDLLSDIPPGTMYWLVTTYEVEPKPDYGILDSENNLWITVNNTTGGVNVAYSVPSFSGSAAALGVRIAEARNLAQNQQSASQ